MTIVCALHFSDSSLAAVKVAAQRARMSGEPLWLVDVLPPQVAAVGEAIAVAGAGVTVHTAALEGPFPRALRQFCAAQRAGLLVVGDSLRTLGPLILGPLDHFADRMSVPVLIVRDADPFGAWASGRPLKVLLAFDRTWRAATARRWIAALAASGAIDLVASYLWSPKDEGKRRLGPPAAQDGGLVPPWVDVEAALSSMPSNVRVRLRREADHPQANQLLRLASAENADVVVLGTRPHRGPVGQQWSVSHELLALAPMSVACIPELRTAPASQPWHREERRLTERTG